MSLMSLDDLQKGIKSMPPLPAVVLELSEMINSGTINLTKIEQKLSEDALLVGRVLSVANSPFYGMAGKIASLNDACRILGTHTIRNIVTAAAVVGQFSPDSLTNVDYTETWRHATAVAIAAKVLAKQVGVDQDEAFTAGLLHDIGKLVLDHFFPQHYEKAFQYKSAHNCELFVAESQVLGITHSDAGAAMATQWGLPANIIAALKGHHQPDQQRPEKLTCLIYCADFIGHALGEENAVDTLTSNLDGIDDSALKFLGISLSELEGRLEMIGQLISNSDSLGT